MGWFSSSNDYKTDPKLLLNVPLEPVQWEKKEVTTPATPIASQSLWEKQPVLMVLIRRPGCLLCRREAHDLSEKRSLIQDQYGVKMIAVVNQEFGAKDFAENYWGGPCYFDRELGLFKAMGDGVVRRGSLLSIFTPSFIKRYREAQKPGIEGNLQGDGSILGGILIVNPKNEVVYEYQEREFGDHAPIETVLEKCSSVRQVA